MYLHLVLQCYLRRRDEFTGAPWRCEVKKTWCEFFDDAARLNWYHDYVMQVVGAARREGYSIADVEAASHDIACPQERTETKEELTTRHAKQSLLKLLRMAHGNRSE